MQAEIDKQKLALEVLSSSGAERSMDWMARLATPDERSLLDELAEMRELVTARADAVSVWAPPRCAS